MKPKKKQPRTKPKPQGFGPLPEPEGSKKWYAEVRRRATLIRKEAMRIRRFGGNPVTPKNHQQEFTCADCGHFDEEILLCRLVQEHRPRRQTRCEGFTLEPLASLGGGSPHSRLEDDWGLGGYVKTREDQG